MSAARGYLHPAMKRREPHGAHPRPRHGDRARRQARRRHPLQQGRPQRHAGRGARRQGGDPERRHGELAAAPAGLGHRTGGAAEDAGHRGQARPAAASARTCATTTRRASWPASRTPRPSTSGRTGLQLVGEVLKYAIARKGILALNPTLIYVFWKSDERVDNYDLQLTFTPAELQGRRAVDPRRLPGHDHRLLAAAARQHRLCARPLGRSVRALPSSSPTISSPKATGACCWPA